MSVLLRDIEHWVKGDCVFAIGAAQPGDLVVYRKGGRVREVIRVKRDGHLWTRSASGKSKLITRPEDFWVMKRGGSTISVRYAIPGQDKATRMGKTGETLAD